MLLNRFNEFGNAFNKSEHVAINDGRSAAASNEDNDWQETGVSLEPEYLSCYVRTRSGTA